VDAAEIERLLALAGSDAEVLTDLEGCVTRMHAARQAKADLARLDSESLRAALAARQQVPRQTWGDTR
jgi:hypothetical protein